MDLTTREHVERRLAGLKTIRLPYEPEWREIARHTQPSKSRFLVTDTNKRTGRSNRAIWNSHGILSFRTLGGGMTSGLSSPSRPWFRCSSYDDDMQGDQDSKLWLGEVERRMYAFLAGTNFYGAVKSGYGEIGAFGTSACVMVDHAIAGAVCHSLTAGEYWIATGDQATSDTLYRQVPMTVAQAIQSFGSKVSARIRTAYDSSRYDQQCSIMHAIEPNQSLDNSVMTAKGKPWQSVYWDTQDSDKVNGVLRESGMEEQPFWAPRWETTGGDAYGSSPGMDALPDLRELQIQTKRKTEATGFLLDPEKIMPTGVKLTGKAGNKVFASSVDAARVEIPYELPYQVLGEILADVERCATSVDRLSYADLFLAITNMQGIQPRNIEEIASRNEEKLTQLGPVIERVNVEQLEVAIDRTFGIMSRKGMFPPAPESLRGKPIKIEFVSILAQMQRMVGIGQLEKTVGFIGNLAAAHPEALDKLNIDEAINEYADRAGSPQKILRSDEEVKGIRDGRAKQQQMQQMASMMPAAKDGATAARLLSEVAQNGGGMQPVGA